MIRIVAVANPFALDYQLIVIVGLRVDKSRLAEVEQHLLKLPEIRFLGVTMGSYDFMLEAWFHSRDDLLIFLTQTLAHVPGITSSDSFQVIKLSKYAYDWGKPS